MENMSEKIRLILALGCAAVFAGCSGTMVESKKIDYKSSGKLPPLEVPPGFVAAIA